MANDPHVLTDPVSASRGETPSPRLELALVPGLVLGGKYRLLRAAGFGGMGAVWVAQNEATAAEVAVKVLVTAREGVDQEAIARFRREAHTAAQLYHRGIVRIFDLVELNFPRDPNDAWEQSSAADSAVRPAGRVPPQTPDALVLVMELLRGETLASHMDKKRRFSQQETLAIVLPLLSALAHAHAQGIVHRDLKPENVFLSVDPDGHVIPKILDFGISKLLQPAAPRITTDGAMLGTPNYMSPEQARGLSNVDARADVFAAGILLYECLSGENPFASGSYHSVVAAILERDPAPLKQASPEVWQVIKRALEKTPELRYADAGDLASALVTAAQTAGVQTPDSSGAYPARGYGSLGDRSVPPAPFREPEMTIPSMFVEAKKRKRLRTTLAAVAIAVALAGAAGFYARSSRPGFVDASSSSVPSPPSADLTPASAPVAASVAVAPPVATVPAAAVPPLGAPLVTIEPAVPEPAASAPSRHAPNHPASPSRGKGPPSTPAGAATAHSAVVRDPGF